MTASPLTDAALLERLVAFDTTSRLSNLPLADFVSDYLDRPAVRIERLPSPDGSKANFVGRARDRGRRRADPLRPHGRGAGRGARVALDALHAHPGGRAYVGPGRGRHEGLPGAGDQPAGARRTRLACGARWRCSSDLRRGDRDPRAPGDSPSSWPDRRRSRATSSSASPPRFAWSGCTRGCSASGSTFRGRAAHSGYPHLGRNAIEPAARAIVGARRAAAELEAERPPHGEHFPEVPFAALNVGMIAGGSAANVIPDRCDGAARHPAAAGTCAPRRWRSGCAQRSPPRCPTRRSSSNALGESPAMMLDEGAELHRELCAHGGPAAARPASHSPRTPDGCSGSASAAPSSGPGSIEVAHRPNECIPDRRVRARRRPARRHHSRADASQA